MTETSAAPDVAPRIGWRRATAVVLGWLAVFVVSGLLSVLGRVARGAPVDAWSALREQAPILTLWALATPLIFAWAQRWPVRPPAHRRHLAVHAALGLALVVVLNAAIRVPLLWSAGDATTFLRSLGQGLSVYLPGALLAYAGLVLVGHALVRSPERVDGDEASTAAPERLAVRTPLRTHLLHVDEIVWIEADDNHIRVHTPEGSYRTRSSISAVEAELPPGAFVRIHRSHLVRVERVREVQPMGNGDQVVVMDDGSELRVARGRRAALAEALGLSV